MTSQINYSAINTAYPIAGQSNDSQGFRDNFTAISAGLAEAATEISALQSNALLSANLSSSAAVVNNLLGSTISNGLYLQFNGTFYNGGTISTATNIDLNNGPAQKFTLAATDTVTFVNWPTASFGSVRVMIVSDQNSVEYPVFSTANAGTIHYDTFFPTNSLTSTPGFLVGGEKVVSVTVTAPGSGYTSQPAINFTGGSPLTNAITPVATATFKAVGATITTGGSGYAVGDQIVLVGGTGGIILQVATVNSGAILTLSVITAGSQSLPLTATYNTNALTGSGSGAKVTISTGINTINVTTSGQGYTTTPPTITITGGGSSNQGTATANLSTNTSTHVKVVDAWSVDGGANVYIKYLGEF
jgi:hypothetical protein